MFTMGPPLRSGGEADPFAANVTALLHFNGANGSTTFTDERGGTWERFSSPYDGAIISTAKSRFGSASLELTNDIIINSAPSAGLTIQGDFTVEGWVYLAIAPTTTNTLFYMNDGAANDIQIYANDTSVSLGYTTDSDLPVNAASNLAGRWAHFFAGVSGSTKYVGVDGLIASAPKSGTAGSAVSIFIGGVADVAMWIDDFRVTKGVCRYTGASYTVPSSEFPNP